MLDDLMNKLLGLFRPAQNSHSGACCGTPISVDSAEPEIVGWMVSEFQKTEHVDLRKDEIAMKRLVEAAQKAKSDLSSAQETTISLPFIGADATGPKHLNLKLTRAKLSELNGYRT